jgi:ankyrin repeat protein
VHQADLQGNNALHGAVFAGHLEIVKYLIEECGADPSCTNGMGCDAIWLSAGYDHVEVLEYLLSKLEGDKRKEALLTTNNSKDSALLAATQWPDDCGGMEV